MEFFATKGIVYKPADEIDIGPNSDEIYLSSNIIKVPRIAGFWAKIAAWLMESFIIGSILNYFVKKSNLILQLLSYAVSQESPLFVPLHPHQGIAKGDEKCLDPDTTPLDKVQEVVDCLPSPKGDLNLKVRRVGFHRWTIMDYARAYTSGDTTPKKVADRFVASVRDSVEMSFFININVDDILKQSMESTSRFEQGKPLSILDGVPVAIKDEIDCMPYPTTGGSKWLHKVRRCKNDACCVSRLRSCGAIIVGKTNMHELGTGVSGINPHYGAAKNPYNINKITGGSSGGSAAVVAAGLCPVALGVDAGGSVRIPAALCGVVGLKPTFARIPTEGLISKHSTVGVVGILAATIEDALIAYAAISGDTSSNHSGAAMPKIGLPLLKCANYKSFGIKMAKYGKWFDDCNEDIRKCCSNAVKELSDKYDWEIVNITVPELETMRFAHLVTVGSETWSNFSGYLKNKPELGCETRVSLSMFGSYNSHEYLNAQRIRKRQLEFHSKIFSLADVIVTPTLGTTAYTIEDNARETGEVDYQNAALLMNYQLAGNFLGLPAITLPVGYNKSGLPIGLQFIGKPWSESLLIHIASAIQAIFMSEYKEPDVFYDLLADDLTG